MTTKEKWAEIIQDFQEKELPEIIPREINVPLKNPIKRSVSIIGPRRAGKTYELYFLIQKIIKDYGKESIFYVDLERADLDIFDYKDLILMLEVFYEIHPKKKDNEIWFFLDEIQNVNKWEKFVRTCLDKGINIFLSGSSSKLLSKEIATSMRGRNLSYKILPFSFQEYLNVKKFNMKQYYSTKEKSLLIGLLRKYLTFGGYPEAVIYDKEKEKILREIFDTAIFKDVIEREKVRNVKVMKLLVSSLINAKEFSINKFYNFLKSRGIKVGKNVLYNYLEYLNDAFFVFPLRKFDLSYKKAEQSIPKIYFIDNGLLTINGIDDKGKLMENLVYIELLRRDLDVAYFQSTTKKEADFIIKQGKRTKQIIQVCYSVADFRTKERELQGLIKASKELNCNNLILINWDKDKEEKFKGKKIKFIPLWKWLLEK